MALIRIIAIILKNRIVSVENMAEHQTNHETERKRTSKHKLVTMLFWLPIIAIVVTAIVAILLFPAERVAGIMSYSDWIMVGTWAALFELFIAFIPFYKKSQRKPTSVYIAFIVALAFEMFGLPLSMYIVTWAVGVSLPAGLLWQHTLEQYIGYWGMYIGYALNLVGAVLVIVGWQSVHRNYWSKEEGLGKLVTNGIYTYVRHPQYAGFMLITLGLLVHWATIPLLIMWPILMVMYYRLAKREEREMEKEFGNQYLDYKKKTSMFFPFIGQEQSIPIR